MDTRITRRAVGDVKSVWRCACPAAASRWIASLVVHLPECARSRSLSPADQVWAYRGARFRTPSGAVVALPATYTSGAREMYCRNVYLRTGLTMPTEGWVADLGANRGLFAVWAAVTGAQVVAVEAQAGFAPMIRTLAAHNAVTERVHVEIGVASGVCTSGAVSGVVGDDLRWAATSHGLPTRPPNLSIPQVMSKYKIDRLRLLKMDIEGGEFAVLAASDDLRWLARVDQVVLEVHRNHGDVASMLERLRGHGFAVDLRDNDGNCAAATSDNVDYAYCRR